jgi:hypothetical protein
MHPLLIVPILSRRTRGPVDDCLQWAVPLLAVGQVQNFPLSQRLKLVMTLDHEPAPANYTIELQRLPSRGSVAGLAVIATPVAVPVCSGATCAYTSRALQARALHRAPGQQACLEPGHVHRSSRAHRARVLILWHRCQGLQVSRVGSHKSTLRTPRAPRRATHSKKRLLQRQQPTSRHPARVLWQRPRAGPASGQVCCMKLQTPYPK